MPPWYYFSRPLNVACHDLTGQSTITPPGYQSLLGLGLKYCPQSRRTITTRALNDMCDRLRKDVYTKYLFAGSDNKNYDPKLHISSGWQPNPAMVPPELRARVEYFCRELKKLLKPKRSPPNLLPHQRQHLKQLKNSEELLLIKTDKNLGPALIERPRYCRWVLHGHLQKSKTFYQYEEYDAISFMKQGVEEIEYWAAQNKKLLTAVDRRFLKRSLLLNKENYYCHCYLLAKIHKEPIASRLICSAAGSVTSGFGILIDRKLQPYGKAAQSYIRSSLDLKEKFESLDDLPSTAKIFTADAVAMYTNIDTKHALSKLKTRVPAHLLEAIRILFKYNIQKFGDCYVSQHNGTAMGVSPACMWATLYFAPWEEKLCRYFQKYILLYVRFIDDVAAAWDFCDDESYKAFKLFKFHMNRYGSLRWKFNEPSLKTEFLDVTLSIKNKRIETQLFEKELNLHLYLPPTSAHPPGVLKGLVHGMIFRIYRLCSEEQVQQDFVKALYRRLLYRGWTEKQLLPLFNESLRRVNNPTPRQQQNREDDNPLILHVPFHPLLPSSREIQTLFRRTLLDHRWSDHTSTPLPDFEHNGNKLGINRLIVAYHRPKNLGNLLAPRKIESTPGPPTSGYKLIM